MYAANQHNESTGLDYVQILCYNPPAFGSRKLLNMPTIFPRLTVRDAFGNQREVEILRTPFTLGRHSDNDLVLLDNRVSRHHARLILEDGEYLIEDTQSRHGTYVNGQQVETYRLKSGDQINLGVADSYTISFEVEQAVLPGLLEKLGEAAESPTPQLHHLGLLLQMAQILLRAPALEEVLTLLVDSAVQLANAERGLLFLREEGGDIRLRLARGRGGIHLGPGVTDYSRSVVDRVAKTGKEEVVLEEQMTGRSAQETGVLLRSGLRGVVAVPLQKLPVSEGSGETIIGAAPELLGVLYLDTRVQATALTGLDRQVLQTLAVEGATVIENARMVRMAREQERVQHEFFLARNMQQTLLPRRLPESEFFQIASMTMPAEAVGGDYYDVVCLPGGYCGFAVADVSGKGLHAAMLSANLQGAFTAVAAGNPDLASLFARVNDYLCERTPPEMFATLFYGVLGPDGKFEFVNAGHVQPLIVRTDRVVRRLDLTNFPVGLFPHVTFEAQSAQLQSGDLVAICSDGVTEAHDAQGELFGEARLKKFLETCAGLPPEEALKRIVAAVRDFVGTAPQSDDITLTVFRYGPCLTPPRPL
jgi:phosphoserine phosphatase RsbU/P